MFRLTGIRTPWEYRSSDLPTELTHRPVIEYRNIDVSSMLTIQNNIDTQF
jgi:hypothetical protein